MAESPACVTCEMVKRRDAGEAPLWDCIFRARHWDVVHSYDTALLGWLVLVARRHIRTVAEMGEDEAIELGVLQRETSRALHTATGCEKTYLAQFAESVEHPHVHVHVVPRMSALPEQGRGPGVFAFLGVPADRRVSEESMTRLAQRLKPLLEAALIRSHG